MGLSPTARSTWAIGIDCEGAKEALAPQALLFGRRSTFLPAKEPNQEPTQAARRAAPGGGLTPGERRVAELVVAGLSNKQVAAQLYVSVYTV
jgi:DNA-binding NarL/FixJ family response regulator